MRLFHTDLTLPLPCELFLTSSDFDMTPGGVGIKETDVVRGKQMTQLWQPYLELPVKITAESANLNPTTQHHPPPSL